MAKKRLESDAEILGSLPELIRQGQSLPTKKAAPLKAPVEPKRRDLQEWVWERSKKPGRKIGLAALFCAVVLGILAI